MKVKARCTQKAFDNDTSRLWLTGEEGEIDHDGKLASLKAGVSGDWVFQFDREAAIIAASTGRYVCQDCGMRFEALNIIGSHTRDVHKRTGWDPPPELEPDPEAEPAEDAGESENTSRRGKVPMHCKGCGLPFGNVRELVKHKLDCPGKLPDPVGQESSDAGQANPA